MAAKKKKTKPKRRGPSPKMKRELEKSKKSAAAARRRARDAEAMVKYDGGNMAMGWALLESALTVGGVGTGATIQAVGDYYWPEWETTTDVALTLAGAGLAVAAGGIGWATGMPRLGCAGIAAGTGLALPGYANGMRELVGRGLDWMMPEGSAPTEPEAAPAPTLVTAP